MVALSLILLSSWLVHLSSSWLPHSRLQHSLQRDDNKQKQSVRMGDIAHYSVSAG